MDKAFRCKLCAHGFNSQCKLNAHSELRHAALRSRPKKHFKCNLCGYEAPHDSSLINHMNTHTGERPFKCQVSGCDKTFKVDSTLRTHIKYKHSEERSFKCKFPGCLHTAKTSSNLLKHKKVHSYDRPFACSECEYKTNRNSDLRMHRMRHHATRREVKCSHPGCAKSFKSSYDLRLHFSNRHEERTIQCDRPGCSKKFANAKALYTHKRDVHSTKSLVCPNLNCSYRTNKSSNLACHMMVHDRENKVISCSLEGCQYKGTDTRTLVKHMHRQHKTGLPCPEADCGYYAPTKEKLKNHMKLHNPSGRPFQCPLCFKHFRKMSQLQDHCVAHTNEKPYECGHCEYAAARHPHVKRHISSFHANIKFPFIAHLLDDLECLNCKVILPTAEFLVHCKDHNQPVV